MMQSDLVSTQIESNLLPPEISLAVDFYNRYPGENICYFVRFCAPSAPGIAVQLSFPKVLEILSYLTVGETAQPTFRFSETEQDLLVTLDVEPPFEAGREYVLEIRAQINTFQFDQRIFAEAILLDAETQPIARDEIQVTVRAKSQYLRFLPEIYQMDDFTSRFLMLVESFWKPISSQIDQVSNYFDPNLVPPEFLPWLSSWVGLDLDMNLPDDRVRALLKQGATLFQCRGTLYGLKTYLEIITGGSVQIQEQRAANFSLGQANSLGVGIALGRKNRPNTIAIRITTTEDELNRLNYTQEMYHRKIAAVVQTLIPAHVRFHLECTFVN